MNHTRTKRLATTNVVAALLGRHDATLSVERQAYRLHEHHTDELVVYRSGPDFWLAARLDDRVTIWAHNDRDAADDAFDERLSAEPGWRVAARRTPALDRPAA